MRTTVLHKSDGCEFVNDEQSSVIIDTVQDSRVLFFKNAPILSGTMSVVGKKEFLGPLGEHFDSVKKDPKIGKKNFEAEEIDFLQSAIIGAIQKANLSLQEVDFLICGDLLNQLTTSNYVARNLKIPYLGLYSACSTMTQALGIGALLVDSGQCKNVVCGVSSHFATAERQFRTPLEYGGQKPPYSQWTVTGAGATVLSSSGQGIKLTAALFGQVVDLGVTDIANMGAAMAPAFVHTLSQFLKHTNTIASNYDLIVSGDLGKLGSDIARTLCLERGILLGQNYIDCGAIIYDNSQKTYQGGSGCGCSASVVNSFVLNRMKQGMYSKVLYLATGALMSPQSCFQGETIPCISHAVLFEA
ncbi:MAG: stage V sporulation protein AD [Clostridiales bacterium]|jgi:stage V sporulation protein AD|nr:stage V sporulation protein AD [Clostridiales bacterium]